MTEDWNELSQFKIQTSTPAKITPLAGRDWVMAVMTRANDLARLEDPNALVEGMLDLMLEIAQAESVNFFQIDSANDDLVITHVRGEMASSHLVGLRLSRAQGMPGLAACDNRVVVVGDLPTEPDWLRVVDPQYAAHLRNVINLPVRNKDQQPLSVIQIYNYQQADVDLLMVLGDRLATELIRRNEIDATQQSNQRLLSLVDMLGEVGGTLDRNRLMHLVTESASRLVNAERSSVYLVDAETRDMIFQVSYKSVDPAQDGPSRAAANQGQKSPAQPKSVKRFKRGEFSYFNRSAITVPLRSAAASSESSADHILGGLMVLNGQNGLFKEEDAHLLTILANQASTFLQVAEMYEGASELFLGVIKALATAIDAKDPSTQGHSQRVSDYSVYIARELGIDETSVNDLRIGSLFHDIGKIGIPDGILLKKGRLDEHEIEYVKLHPRKGVNILSQVKLLEPMTPAILEHHERLDGSGYPMKLVGKQISWMGRIVAVADVFDAMTSTRPYREAASQEDVLAYLYSKAGIHFDPECVRALERILSRPHNVRSDSGGPMFLDDEYS